MQTPPRYAKIYKCQNKSLADVVEQADTRDLKSLGGDFVPVQIRSSAPVRGWLCGRKKHRRTQPSAFLRHAFATPLECRCSRQFEFVTFAWLTIPSRTRYAPYKSGHRHQFAAGYAVAKKHRRTQPSAFLRHFFAKTY